MKILHIINSLETGGAEKLIVETLPFYAKNGIVVDLLLLNGADQPLLTQLTQENCCQIFAIGKRSVYHPNNIIGIIPFVKKYDLLHVHLFPAQYYVVLAKMLSRAKTKLVFTEHNGTNRRLDHFLFRLIDKKIYQFYFQTICITSEIKKILIKHTGLPAAKFPVIENGINLHEIESAVGYSKHSIHYSLRPEDKLIIQVAAFREQKDHETLIKAMALLPADFKLVLVGAGLLKDKCEILAISLGLANRVFFLGIRTDIPQLLKTADIVVLSSKYEGLSLSSIEGMASGKPFVASDVPGLNEVVSGAGILFPVGDEKKLAEEILHLSTDADHYAATAQRCLVRAKNYEISKMVAAHINLYKEILKIQ